MTRNTKIRLSTIALAVSGALAFIGCGGGGGGSSSSYTPPPEVPQPAGMDKLKAMGDPKATITVDGKLFRDASGDGKLDAYEDWRKPADARADALIDAISADKKAAADDVPEGVKQLIGLMNVSNAFVASTKNTEATSGACLVKEGAAGVSTEYPYICEKFAIWMGFMPSRTTTEMMQSGIRYYTIRDNPPLDVLAAWSNNLQKLAAKTSKWGIPVVLTSNPRNHVASGAGFSEAAGVFSSWPAEAGLAAAMLGEKEANGGKYSSLVKEFAENASQEWVATGIRKAYAYQADLATEPRWSRNNGTFGDDPDLVAEIHKQLVEGFQKTSAGNFKLTDKSVALTTKHFPGNGVAPRGVDSHDGKGKWANYTTPNSISWHVKPFQAAIDAGTSSLMTYYQIANSTVDQLPKAFWFSPTQQFEAVGIAYNKKALDWLKADKSQGGLGFKGYINTDSRITIAEGQPHGVENLTPQQRVEKVVNAGIDILSIGNGEYKKELNPLRGTVTEPSHVEVWAVDEMLKNYKEGKISLAKVKSAVKPLLTEMFQLGLFDNPFVDDATAKAKANTADIQKKAHAAHQKSVVLLKNQGDLLPLNVKDSGVKLYVDVLGPQETPLTGTHNVGTNTLRQMLTAKGANLAEFADATHVLLVIKPTTQNLCKTSDAATEETPCPSPYGKATWGEILTEMHRIESLKTSVDISLNSFTLDKKFGPVNTEAVKTPGLEAIMASGKKIIVAIDMGNPWILGNVEPKASAMLATYGVTNQALFDILTGKDAEGKAVKPIGRLPTTVPSNLVELEKKPADMPGHYYVKDHAAYPYKDSEGKVYQFGFGLSYK